MGRCPSLRKSLGQHHLRDPRTALPLVRHLQVQGCSVVEIGSGGGVLTSLLLEQGATRVVALELDLSWAIATEQRLPAGRGTRQTVVCDALAVDWSRVPSTWRVGGNLPYNVGTVLVERILVRAPPGLRCGFLLQKEVVDRMTASPGDSSYGALSVLVAARARARNLGVVPPGAFRPRPRVESAFLAVDIAEPPLLAGEMEVFQRVVRGAFGQRRKTLRNALATALGREKSEHAMELACIDPTWRAEQLSLAQFVALTQAVCRLETEPGSSPRNLSA